jgi:predicted nucleotidyltransferase
MTYGNHSIIDLIPYGKVVAQDGKLTWPDGGAVMNVAGFERLFEDSEEESLFSNVKWRVASIPLFVLNKILAYEDRKLSKDLSAIKYCQTHYGEDCPDGRFTIISETEALLWEDSGAYLLGIEVKPYINEKIKTGVDQFLQRFFSFEAPIIDLVFRGEGRVMPSDSERKTVFGLFDWFAKGLHR